MNINPAVPPVKMKTTISLNGEVDVEMSELKKATFKIENFVQNYCPGYKIIIHQQE